MTLTKEQRLDWLLFMYIVMYSDPSYKYTTLWYTEEEGSSTGFLIVSYIGLSMLPELYDWPPLRINTLEKAIALCEQSKQ